MKIKYLQDFGEGPTLLICSDRDGLRSLSQVILKVAESGDNESVIARSSSILVTARLIDSDRGLHLTGEKNGRKEFDWAVTAPKWIEFSDRLRILADSEKAAHQYLEANDDDATVIASSEDYDKIFEKTDAA